MELDQPDVNMERKDSRHRPYTLYRINSLWVTSYVNYKAIQFREYNVGENWDDLEYSNGFLGTSIHSWEKIGKLNLIKIKEFCSAKENVKRMRRWIEYWAKMLAKDTSDKGLLCKIYTEVLKLNNTKTNNLI